MAMPGGSEWLFFIFVIFVILLFRYFIKKGKEDLANKEVKGDKTTKDVSISSIPDFCPHCKNPNSKKIRICEWCDTQII